MRADSEALFYNILFCLWSILIIFGRLSLAAWVQRGKWTCHRRLSVSVAMFKKIVAEGALKRIKY